MTDVTMPEPPAPVEPDTAPWADLVAALGELAEPVKGGKVNAGQRRYTYLTLPDLLEAVRPVLARNNFAVMQSVWRDGDNVCCYTTLVHYTGWSMDSNTLTQRCGPGVQDLGSVTTYLRRYSLATMVGLAGTDDDDAANVHVPRTAQTAQEDALPPVDPETGEILSEAPSRPGKPYGKPTDQVTRPQLGKIHGLLKEQGITDRDEALQMMAAFARIEGPLESSKDLTKAQAGMVIDELTALTKGSTDG